MADTIRVTNSDVVTLEKGGTAASARVTKTRLMVITGMSQEVLSPPAGQSRNTIT